MATLVVLPSKRKKDVQKYAFDFSNILGPSEDIADAAVIARVFSGEDPAPEAILLGDWEATDKVITQVVQQGIEGVIYELHIEVTTTLDFVYTIEARLAILPDNTQATPNRYPFLFSSRPYPVFSQSATAISAGMVGGQKDGVFAFGESSQESAIGMSFIDGTLRIVFKSGDTFNDIGISITFPEAFVKTAIKYGSPDPTESAISISFGDGSGTPAGILATPNAITTRTVETIGISASFVGGTLSEP